MLPSQSARPSSSRAHMYRRRRGRRIPIIVALAVVLGGGIVGLKLWPGASNPSPADASPSTDTGALNTPTGPGPAMMTALLPDDNDKAAKAPARPPAVKHDESTQTDGQPRINMGPSPQKSAEHSAVEAPKTQQVPEAEAPPAAPVSDQTQAKTAKPAEPPSAPAETNSQIGRSNEPAANTPSATINPSTSSGTAAQRMTTGMDLLARNKAVDSRKMLSEALQTQSGGAPGGGGLNNADADRIRTTLSELNQKLVFGTEVAPSDPYARLYAIEAGDVLAKLPRKLSLDVDWRFLQRINRLQDPTRMQVGQKIKIVTGPFHAVVSKRDFRLDLYMGNGDGRIFVRSFPVGLGEFDATPEGAFMIRPNSKLINPEWVNPRTGERYFADDPNNPIGERWIGLVGVSDNIRDLSGYGIHGTIDPSSIGQQKSMGCVRMSEDDVELMYEVLMENVSRVEIQGEDYP